MAEVKIGETSKQKSYNVSQFYKNANILITGATGFLGKALLEKLLRSCDAKNIYLLIRPKNGVSSQSRLTELLKCPAFCKVKDERSEYLHKIKIIDGDIAKDNLGLNESDRCMLTDQVNIVFHSAAIIKFSQNLSQVLNMNLLGTKRLLDLCKEMKQLQSFVYVSTAYCNVNKENVEEIVYKPPYDPKFIISCVQTLPPEEMDIIGSRFIGKYRNNYLFSKALAEYVVMEYSKFLPVSIVRPTCVTASWKEPFPGWIDSYFGANAFFIMAMLGTMQFCWSSKFSSSHMVPVDTTAKTLIAAAWHSAVFGSSIKVYTCTSKPSDGITWAKVMKLAQKYATEYPSKYLVRYPNLSCIENKTMFDVCHVIYHFLPALIYDACLFIWNRKPKMVKSAKRCKELNELTEFATIQNNFFHTTAFENLAKAVQEAEDGQTFSIDLSKNSGFSWGEYLKIYVLGVRQYVLKDDLSSLSSARNKLAWISRVTTVMKVVFVSVLLWIVLFMVGIYL